MAIIIEEIPQTFMLPAVSVEYFLFDTLSNDNKDMIITFQFSPNATFTVLAKIDGLPTALIDYDQYWTSSAQSWELVVAAGLALRNSYVGVALVNMDSLPFQFTVFMRLGSPRSPSASEHPTAPANYYLTMVVGFILVGMILPILLVLAGCLWLAKKRRDNRNH
jgi:hypothetical protein